MNRILATAALTLVVTACGSAPKPLTAEERAVRSVDDASECEYMGSAQALTTGSDMTLNESIRRHTVKNGGDSFQILHTREGYSDYFGRTTKAEIEIYRCRN